MDASAEISSGMLYRFKLTLQRMTLAWENPLSAALLSGIIFTGITSLAGAPWRTSTHAYLNYLADAFLHGQLYLRQIPPLTLDLSLYQGRYYLFWGPLPAVLDMPLVAIFGLGVSDVLQSIFFAALTAALFALLLRRMTQREFVVLTPVQRGLLVLFFILGTAITPLPAPGSIWYQIQIESVALSLLAYLAAFTLRGRAAFFWTGCAIAAVLLTRPSCVFIAIFLAWYLLRQEWPIKTSDRDAWRRLMACCGLGLLPVIVALAITFLYNFARFGNPLETGVAYHQMADSFVENFHRYGVLSPHYIPINLFLNYLYYPFITLAQGWMVGVGGNLFLLSPLFFAAPYAVWQDRRSPQTWALLASIVLGNIPVLMIMAPGSLQFGPRYFLDFTVPLLVLTALGMRRWKTGWVALLVALSVSQYLVGAIMIVFAFRNSPI